MKLKFDISGQKELQVYKVYVLIDPEGTPFYVGTTKRTIHNRTAQHVTWARKGYGENPPLNARISEIVDSGKLPQVEIFAQVLDKQTALDIETTLTQEYRQKYGDKILNIYDGVSKPASTRAKVAENNRTRVYTDEMRETRSKISKKHGISPQMKAASIAANTGRVKTVEERATLSAAHKGIPKSDSHKASINERRKNPTEAMKFNWQEIEDDRGVRYPTQEAAAKAIGCSVGSVRYALKGKGNGAPAKDGTRRLFRKVK